ncbi:MAG: hypothetical protein U0Q15_05435 [Kineosporiaceae bacterium]
MEAARKHSGRRHAGAAPTSWGLWVTTAAAVTVIAAAAALTGGGPSPVTAPPDRILLGAEQGGVPADRPADPPADPPAEAGPSDPAPAEVGGTAPPLAPPSAPVQVPAPAAPALPEGSAAGTKRPAVAPATRRPVKTPSHPKARPGTRTARPASSNTPHPSGSPAPATSTRPPSTTPAGPITTPAPTPSATRTLKPCKVGCVLLRQRFETGTQGWTATGGAGVEPASGGSSGPGSLRASGVTTSSGPSLALSDARLSGADRRWVSVSLRVRVADADGARLRLRVDGAEKARVRELAADGRWRTLRAWFLPDGPVTMRVVVAPSSCASSPRTVSDLYLDDVVVSVTTPDSSRSGSASPDPVCW